MPPPPSLPSFPLFPDPVAAGSIEPSPDTCDICGEARGFIYTGPTYGEDLGEDEPAICPWCIADGAAANKGLRFNDSTIYGLKATTTFSKADAELIEQRTPGFTTWQGNHWLMCCGRPCIYRGEADAEDLLEGGRWSSAVPSMFEDEDRDDDEIEEILEDIEQGGSPAAYIFQCQSCRAFKGYWDCD